MTGKKDICQAFLMAGTLVAPLMMAIAMTTSKLEHLGKGEKTRDQTDCTPTAGWAK